MIRLTAGESLVKKNSQTLICGVHNRYFDKDGRIYHWFSSENELNKENDKVRGKYTHNERDDYWYKATLNAACCHCCTDLGNITRGEDGFCVRIKKQATFNLFSYDTYSIVQEFLEKEHVDIGKTSKFFGKKDNNECCLEPQIQYIGGK